MEEITVKQDIVHYLMENPLVLTKLACGEASLIGVRINCYLPLLRFLKETLVNQKMQGIFGNND